MRSNSAPKAFSRSFDTTHKTEIESLRMSHISTTRRVISMFLDGEIYPRQGGLHQGPCLNLPLRPTIRVLAGGNPHGNRKYSGPIRQNLRSYKIEEIHLIRQNLCLHEHLQSPTKSSNAGILERRLAANFGLRAHPFPLQKMSRTW
jgi:hypothetical protein